MAHIWSQVAVFLGLGYIVVVTLAQCSLCILITKILTTKSFVFAGKPTQAYARQELSW